MQDAQSRMQRVKVACFAPSWATPRHCWARARRGEGVQRAAARKAREAVRIQKCRRSGVIFSQIRLPWLWNYPLIFFGKEWGQRRSESITSAPR
jgi:hypothetical protein